MARPSSFTQAKADLICDLLSDGLSLRQICCMEDMPERNTVFRWLEASPAFQRQYARARELQADHYAEEIIEISDDGSRDYNKDEEGNLIVDHDHIQRSRLRVDSRKWAASKLAPKKYGDRMQLANDPESPLVGQTDEQIDARLSALMAKASGNAQPE